MPALSAPSAKIWTLRSVREGMAMEMARIEVPGSGVGKDNTGGLGEGFYREIGGGLQVLGVPEIDEDGAHAGPLAAVDVAPPVAHHPRFCKVEPEGGGGVEQHARPGFAAPGRLAPARVVADLDALDLRHERLEP